MLIEFFLDVSNSIYDSKYLYMWKKTILKYIIANKWRLFEFQCLIYNFNNKNRSIYKMARLKKKNNKSLNKNKQKMFAIIIIKFAYILNVI